MQTRLLGYGTCCMGYHIIRMSKYRRRILNPGLRGYLAC